MPDRRRETQHIPVAPSHTRSTHPTAHGPCVDYDATYQPPSAARPSLDAAPRVRIRWLRAFRASATAVEPSESACSHNVGPRAPTADARDTVRKTVAPFRARETDRPQPRAGFEATRMMIDHTTRARSKTRCSSRASSSSSSLSGRPRRRRRCRLRGGGVLRAPYGVAGGARSGGVVVACGLSICVWCVACVSCGLKKRGRRGWFGGCGVC